MARSYRCTIMRTQIIMLCLLPISTAHAANATRGAELYEQRCGGCHAVDVNRIGPMHRNVFGRKAGSLQNFDYSSALRAAKLHWDQTSLDAWLSNPEKLVPGQRMGYSVENAVDRADLIAYLRSVSR